MTTFATDVSLEPTYLDLIDIAAGYGVLSVPVDGLLPGDVVQLASLAIYPTAGGAPIISAGVDMVQRTGGYFEWVTQAEIDAHFTLTAANIASIAAGSYSYSVSLTIVRNGVTLTREVQSGTIAARTASGPTPPVIVNSVTMTGGPVSGGIGTTAQLHASAYDGLGNLVPTAVIVWSSSNPLVASVDQTGLVSFLLPGSTTIIASCQGAQATTGATANDPAFVAPSNKQVAGWLTADNAWKPHTLDASWIQPGTFGGAGTFTFPAAVVGTSFAGDGSALTNVAAANIAGVLPTPHGGTGVASPTAGNLLVGAGASAMTALAPGGAGGYVRSDGTTWTRALPLTADISDLTTAATGITKVGTISTGTWQGTAIGTLYTVAQLIDLTGTLNRVTVGGTSTHPTVDISAAYVGQASITTLGTITTGVWNGSSIATTYTDAKIKTVTGTLNRLTVAGTATDPTFDIDAAYVGQNTITTLGTITTGVWNGTAIGTAYTTAQLVSLTGTLNRVTIGGTATAPTVDISASYIGQGSITTVGTIAFGTWQGTAIADTYLVGLSVSKLTGTTLPASIVTSSLTTVGTIGTGTWQGTVISPTYGGTGVNNGTSTISLAANLATSGAFGLTLTVTALTNVTLPTSGTLVNTAVTSLASLATVGTITAGVWNGTAITNTYIASGLDVGKLTAGTTLPAQVVSSSLTSVGTIATGVWQGTAIANTYIASGLDVTKLTAGATLPANVTGSSLTSVGTIATGVWQGSSIATTYTAAKIVSVAGTASRVSASTVAGAVTLDIDAAYVGQTSITTLGTVSTGTWGATTIATTVGGTGITTYTLGNILYASGANTLAKLAGNITSTKQYLSQTGTGAVSAAPAWATIATADIGDLSSAATGITQVGTVTTGTWNAGVVGPQYGGTGVNNASSTITLGGSFTTSGAFNLVLTLTAGTSVTLPTSGTLVNTAVTTLSSLTTVGVLASPHMTTATVDSGGLRVALGHLGVGAGADPTVGVLVNATDFTGTSQFGFYSAPTFGSAATAAGYGLYIATKTAVASFTVANLYNIRISDASLGAGSAVTTQYGLYIDSLAAASGTDYAIFTNAGLVSFGDAVTVRANGLAITAGGLTVSAGGAAITGNSSVTGTFQSSSTLTVSAGGIAVTGNSTITGTLSGLTALTVTSGNLTVSAGNITVSAGTVGLGTAAISQQGIRMSGLTLTGATIQVGALIFPNFDSGATTTGRCIQTAVITQAAAFTMVNGYGYYGQRASLGAGSAVTNMYGIYLEDVVDGGTLNYALYTNAGLVRFGGATTIASGGLTVTAGNIGVGVAAAASIGLRVTLTMTGSTSEYGIYSNPTFDSSATTAGRSIYINGGTAAAAFTMASMYGAYIDTMSAGAGSTVTTLYGIYINNQSAGGTNYAIYTNSGLVRFGGAFACNGATPQTAFASGGAAPAGGTGTAAGGWDTAAHRDAAITLINNMRTALVNNGIMS